MPVSSTRNKSGRRQGIFWMLTSPQHCFTPYLPVPCQWIKGQLESGSGGYLHWQIIVAFSKKQSLVGVQTVFGKGIHAELTRSSAAGDYVWKDETRVAGTCFELGAAPIARNVAHDWDNIWEHAKAGRIDSIPSSIRFQSYRTIRSIAADYATPLQVDRLVFVFWGRSGSGKSTRAWSEAGLDAYPKDPRSKFWCGYSGQECVIIDEFRGGIDVAHILRWLDSFPVIVEIKGSSTILRASRIWITSNLPPESWYPDLDPETLTALRRRLKVTHFN